MVLNVDPLGCTQEEIIVNYCFPPALSTSSTVASGLSKISVLEDSSTRYVIEGALLIPIPG